MLAMEELKGTLYEDSLKSHVLDIVAKLRHQRVTAAYISGRKGDMAREYTGSSLCLDDFLSLVKVQNVIRDWFCHKFSVSTSQF